MFQQIHNMRLFRQSNPPYHHFRQLALLFLIGSCGILLLLCPRPIFAQTKPFATPTSLPDATGGSDVALGDVDNDGDLDIFVANSEGSMLWFNIGDHSFVPSRQNKSSDSNVQFPGAYAVLLGDLDNDGDLDAFLLSDKKLSEEQHKYLGNLL